MNYRNLILFAVIFLLLTSCGNNKRIKLVNTNFNEEISQEQNLYFEFNRDMVPDTLINFWDSTEYLSIKPEIKGRFIWESARELVFVPSAPFPPSTAFEARFTRQLRKHLDKKLRMPKEVVKFNTPFLAMTSVGAYWTLSEDGTNKVELLLSLYFNYEVESAEVTSRLKIFQDKKEISFKNASGPKTDVVSIRVDPELLVNKKRNYLNIILEAGLGLAGSNYSIKDKTELSTNIPPKDKIQVLAIEPYFEEGIGFINVKLSQAYLNENINEVVKINPKVKYSIEKQINGFLLRGDFIENNTYNLSISGKLKGIFGYEMGKEYKESVNFGTLEPYLSFDDQGSIYLSPRGNRNIALKLINIPEINVSFFKIYENNILHFLREGKRWDWYYDGDEWHDYYSYDMNENYGKSILSKTINTRNLPRNGNISLLNINLREIEYSSELKGIYLVKAEASNKKYLSDIQLLAVSDLGLIVKRGHEKTYIFVNSLQTAKALGGVDISLISSNNQVIMKAKTNDKGVAVIDHKDPKFEGFQLAMITARQGDDFNFILLSQTMLEMSRYDVGGKHTVGLDYDIFIYGDRNLYRPGDKVFINSIVRDLKWQTQSKVPLKFHVLLPNGRKLHTFRKETNEQGACELSFDIPADNMTGTYIVEVYSGNDILLNTYHFAVEEFMPDRIKVETKLDKNEYQSGNKLNIAITATNFFGPPAANRKTEAELNMRRKSFSPKGLGEYYFGIKADKSINFSNVVSESRTGQDGKVDFNFDLPDNKGIGIIEGKIFTSVFDETGRAVNRVNTFNIYTQSIFFGIGNMDTWVSTRKAMNLKFIGVNAKGQPVENASARIEIRRYHWETVMENRGGRLYYNSQKREQVILTRNVSLGKGGSLLNFTPANSGEYEVRISSPGYEGYVSRTFYAYGWADTEYTSFKTDKEGHISISSDKDKYESGESADLLFKSPFEGRLIITIERGDILNYYYLDTRDRAANLRLNLGDEHLPNIYVTATAIKEMGRDNQLLTVAHGVININVVKKDTRINVNISSPEQVRSKQKQRIMVKTTAGAEVTLAIVDEGILQLSNYTSPDPHDYFYQKRALEVSAYNIYKYLYPEIGFRSSAAGDISLDLSKRVNPLTNKRVKLLSLWSGQMKADKKGECFFEADIPQFSGSVRIMAVAYKDNSFGSAEKNMRIADPIVISSALPRFLSPADQAQMLVNLSNTTDRSSNLQISLNVSGPLKIEGEKTMKATVKAGSEEQITFNIEALNYIGEAKITVRVQSGQEVFTEETDITVRPSAGLQKIFGSGSVSAGQTEKLDIKTDFIDKNLHTKLILSPSPMIEFANDLKFLIQYPFGCLEQTISTAFPQIYLKDLILLVDKGSGITERSIDYNVQQAVHKIQAMQMYDGGFAYWPGSYNRNVWSSVYATHFLIEAQKAGYEVAPDKLEQAYTFLKNIVRNKAVDTWHYYNAQNQLQYRTVASRETFYAIFVLALSGQENRSVMNYYKANQDQMTTDSRFLLSGAYALTGDKNSYNTIVPKAWDDFRSVRAFSGSFYSWMRDKGIALYVLAETDPANRLVPVLSNEISRELKTQSWFSTQERVFAILALGKLAKRSRSSNLTATVSIGNTTNHNYVNKNLLITDNFNNKEVSISAKGEGILYYTYMIEGISASGIVEEKDNNLMVRKRFYDRNGNAISGSSFKQNDLVVVEITLRSLSGRNIENVAVTDILPACFEIENPRLITERDMGWIKFRSTPDYMDIRDDRINFFTTATAMDKKFYYTIRVVTTGTFRMGPVSADAMYDGNYSSVNGAMTVNAR